MRGGGGLDLNRLMKQAQEIQKATARVQEDLKERIVEGTAGGGAVSVKANGQQEIVAVTIKPEVVDAKDVAMLEDLIAAAVNQAVKKAKDLAQAEIQKATGGAVPPGLI